MQHSDEAVRTVRRYTKVSSTAARRMLDALADLEAAEPVPGEPSAYPHESAIDDTPVTVLGPGVFVSADEQVLSWGGENYVPQPDPDEPSRSGGFLDPSGPTVRSLVETLSAAQSRFTASKVDVDKRDVRIAHLQYLIDCLTDDSPHEPQAWGSPDGPSHRAEPDSPADG